MKKRVKQFYLKKSERALFNVWIPAILTVVVFASRYAPQEYGFIGGIIATILIPTHAYILKIARDAKLNELDFWKKKSINYSWLLNSIEKLIYHKINTLKKGIDEHKQNKFKIESIWKNLQMLYEFYVHYFMDPTMKLKIVFFVPSRDNSYLISRFWYNESHQKPHSYENEIRQKELFAKHSSKSLAVKAWNTRKTEVAESEKEILHHYQGQEQTIKSIIAYPICGQKSSEILGIITVSANMNHFFKCSDITTHEEYIKQAAIRIALEMSRIKNA